VNRLLLCLLIGVGYLFVRDGETASRPTVKPIGVLAERARALTKEERAGLSEAYAILARSIESNPEADPVYPDCAAVRRAHRAAIQVVWHGVFGNQPGKYPGLREAIEGEVERGLGTADVPLTPALQQQAAKTFSDISASLK
jgi:hypothetical protein